MNLLILLRWTRLAVLLIGMGPLFYGISSAAPFTVAVLPDTQIYATTDTLAQGFTAQTTWIANNVAAENIKFVTHLGDLVQNGGTDNDAEWQRMDAALAVLDAANVPWATAVGNHELDQPDVLDSGYTTWKSFYGPATSGRFAGRSWFGGAAPNDLSSYQFFTDDDNDRKYMMLHMEMDMPDDAIAWAQGVIDANPGVPTIISTHSHLGILRTPWLASPTRNSYEQVFNELITDNSQIFMILNGHNGMEDSRTRTNAVGLPVFEMVQDYAGRANGGDGWMRLLRFDESNNEIRVETFTPGVPANPTPRFETDANSQFILPLDWGVRFDGEEPPPPAGIIDNFSANTSANYTYSDSWNSGGSFAISGGTLNLTTGSSNTATVVLDDGVNLMRVGQRWSVDVIGMETNSFMLVSTIADQPDAATSYGFRFRRDEGGFRVHTYDSSGSSISDYYADPGGSVSFMIERISETDFRFSERHPDGSLNVLGVFSNDALAGMPELYVGMQEYGSGVTQAFDNLTKENMVSFQQGIVGYNGTVDTHILSVDPTVDKSVEPKTRIVGMNVNNGEAQGLIRFDDLIGDEVGQIPAGSIIESAVLRVQTGGTQYDGTSSGTTIRIHRLLQGFDDTDTWSDSFGGNGVQFDDVDAVTMADFITAPGVAAIDGSLISLDVTASLQAWADGEANYGWVIAENPDSANNWYFYSAEGTTPPLLEVTFKAANEEPIAGDANNDGRVDGSDVTILAGNWQHGVTGTADATWEMGDFNNDGRVDGSDITILAGNWQAGVTVTATTVPEPSMLTILNLVSLGLLTLRRNRAQLR